jgi:hypothetical protein
MFKEDTVIKGQRTEEVDTGHKVLQVSIDGKELTPRKSQLILNHSPDGFECGYGGSGPAQLALAILTEALGSKNDWQAIEMHQKFKVDMIAPLPQDAGWTITGAQVIEWLAKQRGIVRAC